MNRIVRLKVILLNSKLKDWPAILLFALNPKSRRKGKHFKLFLEKKNIIKDFPSENKFSFLDFKFFHHSPDLAALLSDIISIWGNDFPFFSERLVNNKAFEFEGSYCNKEASIKEGDFVVDAGANIGLFSAFASRKVGSTGCIYAFEPITTTREDLTKNIAANNLKNISVIPFALGDTSGEKEFSILSDPGSNAESGLVERYQEIGREKVSVKTLDEMVSSGLVKQVDFIKADIEGMERNFINGARGAIKKFHPCLAICTYHRPDDKEVIGGLISEIEPRYKIYFSNKKIIAVYEKSDERKK